MRKSLQDLLVAINRTIIPHDVDFYRRCEHRLLDNLLMQQRQGEVVKVEDAGKIGIIIDDILDQFFLHPLCKSVLKKPQVYLDYNINSQFFTFSNIIIVPLVEVSDLAKGNSKCMSIVKAGIAHELGHIISRDCNPITRANNPHYSMNQMSERRADLIAAHLCGDGGKALADHLAARLPIEKLAQKILHDQTSWVDKVIGQAAAGLDRRYPPTEERIRYLRGWASKHQKGQKLPDISSLQNTLSL